MLREVGKTYSRSLRMLFQYPQFLLLTAAYLFYTYTDRYIDQLFRTPNSLGLYVLVYWLKFPIFLCVFTGFPLALLLMSNQVETGLNLKAVFQQTKEFFWKFFRQSLAGGFLALIYSSLVVCLTFVFVIANNATLSLIFLVIFFLVIGFLSLGSVTMGQRILLDGGQGAFQNSFDGIRLLTENFRFFLTLFFVTTLISAAISSIRYALGSYLTGIDLFAVPISDFPAFIKNIYYATQTPVVYVWDFLLGLIIWPFYALINTFAYQRAKNSKANHSLLKTAH